MTKLAILLTDGFADWESAPLMAIGRNYLNTGILTVSPGGAPATSLGGLHVNPDIALDALTPETFGGLAIIGGSIWETPQAPDVGPAIRAFRRADRAVGGICTGVLAIARTGILRGISHTGNTKALLAQSEHYQAHSSYMDVPFAVRDGHIVTASGMAAMSFAREMLTAIGAMTPEARVTFDRFEDEYWYRKAS